MWDVDRITKFIISCCVLHNICIDANDDAPIDDNNDDGDHNIGNDNDDENPDFDPAYTARQLRQHGEIKRMDVCAAMQ